MANTFFIFPPSHRLFVVFDDSERSVGALHEASASGLTESDDAWIFSGEEGLAAVDPGLKRHGVTVGIVRVFQRLMTSDCEYCEGLSRALRAGAIVMALKVDEAAVDEVSDILRRHGGHSMAYGAHWNFVPLPHATHATGAIADFVPGSGRGAASRVVLPPRASARGWTSRSSAAAHPSLPMGTPSDPANGVTVGLTAPRRRTVHWKVTSSVRCRECPGSQKKGGHPIGRSRRSILVRTKTCTRSVDGARHRCHCCATCRYSSWHRPPSSSS